MRFSPVLLSLTVGSLAGCAVIGNYTAWADFILQSVAIVAPLVL